MTSRSPGAPASTRDEIRLREVMRRYDQLGDVPPELNIRANDAAYAKDGAHTIARHGSGIPLPRSPGTRTIEGRVYGDPPWGKRVSASYRWTDRSTMKSEVDRYIKDNWEAIRSDLAVDEFHEQLFDAGYRVGEGYYNKGMYGAGPREAEYGETSLVRIRIRLVEGSDPAEPFLVTAFPAGLG